MTTRGIEHDHSIEKRGVDRAEIPASDREADAQANGIPPTSRHEVNHRHPVIWMSLAKPVTTIESVRGASALAIVSEIEACARNFVETGEDGSIDLRCLKAMPEEREILAGMLGEGEISAVVDTAGRTEIRETSVPCVWWIRHHDLEGATVGEVIEITGIPDLMVGDRKAVTHGLEALDAARQFRAVDHPHSNAR